MPAQKNDLSFKEMEVDLKQLKHPLTWYHHEVMPGEIDSFQVVNYSRYYEWLSAALLKFFENQGLDATGKFENGTKEMRVARVKTAYISSARIGEQVDVIIHRLTLKQRHMVIYYRVKCKHRLLLRSALTMAFVNASTNELTGLARDLVSAVLPDRAV